MAKAVSDQLARGALKFSETRLVILCQGRVWFGWLIGSSEVFDCPLESVEGSVSLLILLPSWPLYLIVP